GRGRFSSPRGHDGSRQSVRRCETTASVCAEVSSSANDGMIGEKPRPCPPCAIVALQSTSGSGVVDEQSLKSGNVDGRSHIVDVCGAPSPFGPWQPAQPAS